MSSEGFMNRLARYNDAYKEKKNVKAPLDRECTFTPRKFGKKETHIVEGGSDRFFERMEEDIAVRRALIEHNSTKILCPFQPQLPENKFNARSKSASVSFIDRMNADLESRKEGKIAREQDAIARDLGACTFHPEVTKKSERPSFATFLNRYEADLEEREQKEELRKKLFEKPPKIVPLSYSQNYYKMKARASVE